MDEDRTRWDERYAGSPRRPGRPRREAPEALALLDDVDASPSSRRPGSPSTSPAEPAPNRCGWRSVGWTSSRSTCRRSRSTSTAAAAGRTDLARIGSTPASTTSTRACPPDAARRVDDRVPTIPRPRPLPADRRGVWRPGGVAIITVLSAVGLDGTPGEFHAPAGELDRRVRHRQGRRPRQLRSRRRRLDRHPATLSSRGERRHWLAASSGAQRLGG